MKYIRMSVRELADAHGFPSRQPFGVVVHSCHHTILVGVHGAIEVLD
jgi:hypothetical protein